MAIICFVYGSVGDMEKRIYTVDMYTVYILLCEDDSLYTGITTDMNRRFQEHKEGIGSRYTRARGVLKLLYVEEAKNRSEASKREHEIKQMSREKKMAMIGLKNAHNKEGW